MCGIIGSPCSMNMVCPDNIGRDSWDRGGQESVVCPGLTPPKNLGEETPRGVDLLLVEADRPQIQNYCC